MNTDAIESLSLEVVHIIEPLIAITIALTLGLALKDFAVNLIAGLRFKWAEAWAEGQKVYIDDEEATIIKISMSETVFAIRNGRGLVWRHVANEKIRSLKIERIIERPNADQSDGH